MNRMKIIPCSSDIRQMVVMKSSKMLIMTSSCPLFAMIMILYHRVVVFFQTGSDDKVYFQSCMDFCVYIIELPWIMNLKVWNHPYDTSLVFHVHETLIHFIKNILKIVNSFPWTQPWVVNLYNKHDPIFILIVFRPYINMEGKLSTQREDFFHAYLLIDNVRCWNSPMLDGSELEFFLSPNYNKFAIECDWNGQILKCVRSLGILKKLQKSEKF